MLVKSDFLEHVREKIIRSHMDVFILKEMKRNSNLSGYDAVVSIHKKFGILLSSGTVYSALYSLERSGLIKGKKSSRKTIYKLTAKGEETLHAIKKTKKELQRLTAKIF